MQLKPTNETVLKTKSAYKSNIVQVEEQLIDFGNGKQKTFEVISFPVQTGVSALPLLDAETIMLIRHYQAGIRQRIYGLPTGGLAVGESPEERMQLELQEEIGYKAGKLTLMGRNHILPGYIGVEPGYVFLAEQLESSTLQGDEPFDIEIHTFKLDEALKMVKAGEILDGRTVYTILLYNTFYK